MTEQPPPTFKEAWDDLMAVTVRPLTIAILRMLTRAVRYITVLVRRLGDHLETQRKTHS